MYRLDFKVQETFQLPCTDSRKDSNRLLIKQKKNAKRSFKKLHSESTFKPKKTVRTGNPNEVRMTSVSFIFSFLGLISFYSSYIFGIDQMLVATVYVQGRFPCVLNSGFG